MPAQQGLGKPYFATGMEALYLDDVRFGELIGFICLSVYDDTVQYTHLTPP